MNFMPMNFEKVDKMDKFLAKVNLQKERKERKNPNGHITVKLSA